MLRPTPGELLLGLRRELHDQVLPALPPGAAARQLRAALHVLRQLARSWDRQPAYLEADNADLERTLAELSRLTGIARRRRDICDAPLPGVGDPELRRLIATNDALQTELDALQHECRSAASPNGPVERTLRDLHTRMASRAAAASGHDES
jgi:hypothetical protein